MNQNRIWFADGHQCWLNSTSNMSPFLLGVLASKNTSVHKLVHSRAWSTSRLSIDGVSASRPTVCLDTAQPIVTVLAEIVAPHNDSHGNVNNFARSCHTQLFRASKIISSIVYELAQCVRTLQFGRLAGHQYSLEHRYHIQYPT